MVWAKIIYILLIKVNKLFPFFVAVFPDRNRNTCESLGELKKSCGNTHLSLVFPQLSSFSQTSISLNEHSYAK